MGNVVDLVKVAGKLLPDVLWRYFVYSFEAGQECFKKNKSGSTQYHRE